MLEIIFFIEEVFDLRMDSKSMSIVTRLYVLNCSNSILLRYSSLVQIIKYIYITFV